MVDKDTLKIVNDALDAVKLMNREWQGLSDDDAIMKLAEYHGVDSLYETGVLDFAHAIEQALKEKNKC